MHRYLRPLVLLVALPLISVVALAQGTTGGSTSAVDSLYQKAQRLVMSGNGADGRAIVDSLLAASAPGSPDYAEALYWKAALADNAAEAERGYLQLTIEYPLSMRAEAALLRLGQLELTRGNRSAALSRFQRAAREFPSSPQRANSWYNVARIQLEDGRAREGCLAIRDAESALPADDVELRNKVDYLARQCVGVSLASAADSGPATARATAGGRAPASAPSTRPVAPPVVERPTPVAGTVSVPVERKPEPKPQPAPPAKPPAPTPAAPAVVRPPTPRPPTAAPRAATAATGAWSVQVAAFDRAAPAEELAGKLRKDGFDARVDADDTWHRVRIGRYETRAAAADEARALKARGITGFVTGIGG